jgi:hypothetical protein
MVRLLKILTVLIVPLATWSSSAADLKQDAEQAMRRAGAFFRNQVASGGGYVYVYSSDLKHRQGEGVAGPLTIWIQPPGTPAVGEAFLDAYAATGDRFYLDAAQKTGQALVQGQLDSGGWYYRVELDPARRGEFRYHVDQARPGRTRKEDPDEAIGGWDVWRKRKHKDNITVIDDDTTPAAVRFLCRLDKAFERQDRAIYDTVHYALDSLINAQHPIGAWSHNYDAFPLHSPDPAHYPILDASYPETWSRTWTKDFTGGYSINDRVTLNMIKTMLLAAEIYGDGRYGSAAERGGMFLIRAQMPDPQPAWAQQYDRAMHPVWDRKFEPPAITGLESQDALETLLLLHRKTGDPKYLAPIPRALDYLRKSRLEGGRIARFYELKTNRPLYFTRDYELTYDGSQVPTHYGFVFDSRLDAIEAAYLRQRNGAGLSEDEAPQLTPALSAKVRAIIASQDPRGAWTEPGMVRDLEGRKVKSDDGVISAATFIDNMRTLAAFITAGKR